MSSSAVGAILGLMLPVLATPALADPAFGRLNERIVAERVNAERVGRATVRVNHSETVRVPKAFTEVVVGASDIADVMPLSDRSLYLLGKRVGTTSVSIFDGEKRLVGVLDVEVTPNLSLVQSRIRSAIPSARGVRVTYAEGSLVLDGSVPDAPTAERAVAIAKAFSNGQVVNALQVASPQQVLLEVRVVEASRNAGRELGVTFSGQSADGQRFNTGLPLLSGATPFGQIFANVMSASGATADVRIQALEDRGLVRRLASPNLTALSGSTASFLAGGEFPVPVSGETTASGVQQVTISFKKFGVMLDFTPVVLDNGAINLKITPEVSELDFTNAVRNLAVTIPAVVVRRASTEIVLRSGQSFALAGLMANTQRNDAAQLPWIGSVPVLGALFRSQSFQNRETELVIIVTAHLAKPAAPGARLATPLDRTVPANDVDFFVEGKFELFKDYRHYVERGGGVQGPYGHIVDVNALSPAALRARN